MVDAEMRKLMDAIDAFFEKKDTALESKFHITKLMSDEYWAEMTDDDIDDDDEPEPDEPDEPEPDEAEAEEELDGVDDEFDDDEVEDLEEVPDTVPPLEIEDEVPVPKPPGKAHEVGMKNKLLKKAGKLKKHKVKVK